MSHTYYFSGVGNVLGTGGHSVLYEGPTLASAGDAIWDFDDYTGFGVTHDTRNNDPRVTNTLFREGNWDATNNAVMWVNAAAQTITNSLAYSAEPAWYTNECGHCPWPPYDPNLSGEAYPTNTPAGARLFKQGS
jgi:hypothetical protein